MTDLRTVTQTTAASERLFAAAQRVLPGGVNSPVRAFRGVGGTPRFIVRGEGPMLIDADGKEYASADFKRLFVEPGSAVEGSSIDE